MDSLTWGVVLKDMVRRNQDTGEARHVRVMADATKEGGFCLRHLCVDIDCAPDPNAPAHVAPVPSSHLGVWRRGRQTHAKGADATAGDRGGYYRPRSPRRNRSRSPLRDRARSISPPRAILATWPTRASSSAVVSLLLLARVRDVRLRAPRGAAVSAVAHAWVDRGTGLRHAVERPDGREVESLLVMIEQAVARAVDEDANHERFAQHFDAVEPEKAVALSRVSAQSVLRRLLMRTEGTRTRLRRRNATRARVASSRSRGPVLFLATFAVATQVAVMRRRNRVQP